MSQSCRNCSASIFPDANGSPGACRAHPPTATVVLLPRGQVQVELVPTPLFVWPQVSPDQWCREWQELPSKVLLS
jgi:hypothetical protein